MKRALILVILLCGKAHAADAQLKLDIMRCESGLRSNAIGDDGVSRGIAQFRKQTFLEFAAKAKREGAWDSKKLGKPRWLNPTQQEFLLGWALDRGLGYRCTCYRRMFPVMDSKKAVTPNDKLRGRAL